MGRQPESINKPPEVGTFLRPSGALHCSCACACACPCVCACLCVACVCCREAVLISLPSWESVTASSSQSVLSPVKWE